mmetsp:Transcript_14789/g.22276  ORF Transcript_14789/g.22276 Transcript_14789/m.22276 type:complete len:427 (-) Transcript_14789:37-1317(-)
MMIAAILKDKDLAETVRIVIYSTDACKSREVILSNVMHKFHISIPSEEQSRITIIKVPFCSLLDGSRYPFFTMLFQMVATVGLGAICLSKCLPDTFIDTTGAPFMYPLAKLCGCRVVAYVHYPIISSDMLKRVREMRPSYNNDQRIASSASVSSIKLLYYRFIGWAFGLTGYCVDMAFVNSSWTEMHMKDMWRGALNSDTKRYSSGRLIKLFPPCNTTHLKSISLGKRRNRVILSVGQFRPEKDHHLQLRAFHRLLSDDSAGRYKDVRLVLLGSCRNEADENILSTLRKNASSLGITDSVDFVVNAPFERLEAYLSESSIGLHTMWNEHFGISVVEMMAAGMLVVAHNSGGPAMDIIQPFEGHKTGFLATDEGEYAECIAKALNLEQNSPEDAMDIRLHGRKSTDRYSDENFGHSIVHHLGQFLRS